MLGKLLSLAIICIVLWAGFERIRRKFGISKKTPAPFISLGTVKLSKMEAGIALVIGLYVLISLIAFF